MTEKLAQHVNVRLGFLAIGEVSGESQKGNRAKFPVTLGVFPQMNRRRHDRGHIFAALSTERCNGILLASSVRMMTATHRDTTDIHPSSTCMLRWVLANGPAAIACEVDAMTDHAFALRVVPLAAPEDGFVELFCTATSALERHADITERLRDAGWHTDHLTVVAS